MEYRPKLIVTVLISLARIIAYAFSFVVPIGFYVLAIYYMSTLVADSRLVTMLQALTVPLVSLGIFPFTLYLMYVLNLFTEIFMLSLGNMRTHIIRHYIFKTGGAIKSCFLEDHEKKRLKKWGIISASLFVVCIIFAIIAV